MSLGLIISDVHAVAEALDAVFETCPPEEFDFILNCGDTLVFGPNPSEVVDLIEFVGATSIRGNVDEWALEFFHDRAPERPREPMKRWIYEFAAVQLTAEIAQIVETWPREQKIQIEDQLIHMVHGSPADFMEGLTTLTPEERLQELAKISGANIVICGHSHDPFARQIDKTLFINPGCVGRAFDGDRRASCAVLEIEDDNYSVDLLRIEYDWRATLKKMVKFSFPAPIRDALVAGTREKPPITE
ncbi:MAG TPA: hypothetical protein DHU63_11585 [Candidatus Marinimicrobia bacterium]|nr:MAG: hypothetical protein AUJ47_12375 [Candidatus Marinimicrobia bacterium CG1_02_48_14]PIZ70054.1 MAG: hypothetical protein COY19_00745 [Candidatus Marinimicrobia bacterium CG_4_10_14_0_2_um_filter_48_9]PJA54439.1 MAG: hypothetical protein CO167_03820 [Candidatus Marinimicrobia bacterium CG_4_9_14_3_um_filter_48_9]HCW77162.1 hypothetical protein [Candidatus Neomarinimicrobiota bacterium]